jgi:hypothetical protein
MCDTRRSREAVLGGYTRRQTEKEREKTDGQYDTTISPHMFGTITSIKAYQLKRIYQQTTLLDLCLSCTFAFTNHQYITRSQREQKLSSLRH